MASNFIWYELMTTDLKAAETFYKNVVGWDSESWSGDFPYVIMKVGEIASAGLMNIPEEARAMGQPPAWVGYIHADDVDKTTESVRKAGGKVHREPADIPDIGRFSVVADPQGVVFMLMTPQGPEQPRLTGFTPGRIGWHELYAADWQKAFDFYSSQFGWEKSDAMDMGAMGTYQVFSIDGEQAGGMMNKPEQVPVPAWMYYFNVDEINAAVERVKSSGGNVMMGPLQVPGDSGSWIAQCMDPQGAVFAIMAQGS
jgi:predicted enzyme related to lactoylglutathione lyase